MFGRLVDVYISNKTDTIHLVNSALGNKSLVCNAQIKCVPNLQRTTCTLKVYNISKEMKGQLKVGEYKYLIIKFGYKDVNGGMTSTVFEGTVQRMIVQRNDPNTTCCIMYAYELGDAYNYGYFSGEFAKGTSLYDMCMAVAHQGQVDIPLVCTDLFKNMTITKSQSYYDTQMTVLQKIVDDANKNLKRNKIEISKSLGKIYINTSLENENTEVIVMSGADENGRIVSTSGLIKMPTLEDDGLSFECLINPNLKIYSRVLIANSLISDAQEGVERKSEAGAYFDENGIYVVNKIDIKITNTAEESKMRVRALARSMYYGGNANETE